MRSVHSSVASRGGVAATHELLRDGHTSHRLTDAVRSGEVIRARQGHYVVPELSQPEIEAIRIGGRLTGLSGARHHGVWTPRDDGVLYVAVPPWARALRSRTDKTIRLRTLIDSRVRVDWNDSGTRGTRSVLPPLACIDAIVRTQPPIAAFAVVESALNRRLIAMSSWQRHLPSLPRSRREHLSSTDRRSESGGESLLKFALLDDDIPFRQQVRIPGVGRVDFLLGDGLVIEVDGAEFHARRDAFEEDRRRDAVLSALGRRVLRFSYRQVDERSTEVRAAILAAVSRGDHWV